MGIDIRPRVYRGRPRSLKRARNNTLELAPSLRLQHGGEELGFVVGQGPSSGSEQQTAQPRPKEVPLRRSAPKVCVYLRLSYAMSGHVKSKRHPLD